MRFTIAPWHRSCHSQQHFYHEFTQFISIASIAVYIAVIVLIVLRLVFSLIMFSMFTRLSDSASSTYEGPQNTDAEHWGLRRIGLCASLGDS